MFTRPTFTKFIKIVLSPISNLTFSPDQETKDALLRRDMDISQDCLVTNPKSYGAWHHRCWCINQVMHRIVVGSYRFSHFEND